MQLLPAARRTVLAATSLALLAASAVVAIHPASAQTGPQLLRDVRTGFDLLGSAKQDATPKDYIQPDTQIEPSIAVNPSNPLNAVTGYQEGRVAGGGDATNGFASTFDGGRTWTYGEVPGLTSYPGQGGRFDRASDAVVAFGSAGDVYFSSLVFDDTSNTIAGNQMHSGMAINVSKDGGRTWSAPVIFADDMLAGLNDKNWVVVDNSDKPGHHKGRVYVVWDRVAALFYDYCDSGCDTLSGWAFGGTMQQVDLPSAYVSQCIGATPAVLNDGSLAVLFEGAAGGVPNGSSAEQTISSVGNEQLTSVLAPLAGSQPFGTPLVFGPPVTISYNLGSATRAQRAGTLPSADYDTRTGTLAIAWEDARFHTETYAVNDILVATSTDGGSTWSTPVRVNPSSPSDGIDRYNASISASGDGILHIAYRSRREADNIKDFSPSVQTYYQESADGGKTWTPPLLVSTPANDVYYGAFSRAGTFQGDYNGIASAGGYSYVVRDESYPAYPGEPPALVSAPTSSDPNQLALTGKDHQHQQTWVAVVGPAAASAPVSPAAQPSQTAAPVAPNAATIGTPNTSAPATPAAVTLLAGGGLLAAATVASRRRRRRD
jgi:hypothetical protein